MNAASAEVLTPPETSVFDLQRRDDGIAVLTMAVPDARQNTIRTEFADEFETILTRIEADTKIVGLVIASAKPGSFLAGADIDMLDRMDSAEVVTAASASGQAGFARLSALHVPVVAAIDGACLGGGLELALAADVRVAATSAETVLGLPEVMLGLLPAAGGTQRLPRLVGIRTALDWMLTGRRLRPDQARRQGLVDAVVAPEALMAEAIRRARIAGKRRLDQKTPLVNRARQRLFEGRDGLTNAALEDTRLGRRLLFEQARKQAQKKARGHYPAIDAIIDVVATGYGRGIEAGLAAESRAFGRLAMSQVSRALRHLYHATETLKKNDFGTGSATARRVRRVGVLGAGLMGAGIATVSLDKAEAHVRLKDVDDTGLARGMGHVRDYYDRRVARGAMRAAEADRRLNSLTGTTRYEGIGPCDLVVEAVFEDLELKQRLLADVEAAADAAGHPELIFASNTSALPIADIAAHAQRPGQVIGLHYFSPVEKMPLLEVIATDTTHPTTIATAVAFGRAQGKTVIVVRDAPGFYTTRALSPYLNEAARCLAEGASVRDIDDALTAAGFPVGPMTLLDEVGIDVGTKVGPFLEAAFGQRMAVPAASQQMLEAGYLGRKTGRGFYDYQAKKNQGRRPVNPALPRVLAAGRTSGRPPSRQEIVQRCTMGFANEAAHCLSEGVIADPVQGDVGAVMGLGFLPFTGGPFRYIDTMGIAAFVARLERLVERYGSRFEPAPIVETMTTAEHPAARRFHQ